MPIVALSARLRHFCSHDAPLRVLKGVGNQERITPNAFDLVIGKIVGVTLRYDAAN